MSDDRERPTATLYPFPQRSMARRVGASQGADAEPPARATAAEFGSGWYHDEAVKQEASRKPIRGVRP